MATPRKIGARGLPDIERRIEIACKRLSANALTFLEKILSDDNVEVRWRLQAAKEIMDRGLGKAKQSIDQKVTMVGGDAFMQVLNEAKNRVAKATEEAEAARVVIVAPVDEVVH